MLPTQAENQQDKNKKTLQLPSKNADKYIDKHGRFEYNLSEQGRNRYRRLAWVAIIYITASGTRQLFFYTYDYGVLIYRYGEDNSAANKSQ